MVSKVLMALCVMVAIFQCATCIGEVSIIDDDEFYDDWEITDLYIPPSIESVSYVTNQQLHALQSYHVDSKSDYLLSIDGVLYSKDMRILYLYPINKADAVFEVPVEVEYIWEYAFSGNEHIEVIFLRNVTGIGDSAFYGCSHLTKVILSDNLICIGNNAFESTDLGDVVFPSSLIWIGNAAFRSTNVRNVILPEGVAALGFEAFALCKDLQSVSLPESLIYMELPITGGGTSIIRINVKESSYADFTLRYRSDVEIAYYR